MVDGEQWREARRSPLAPRFVAALLGLAMVAAVGVAVTRLPDRDVRTERRLLARSPSLVVRPAAAPPPATGLVALLVHGFGCNRSMMMPLAGHLARRGVTSYALDLPGHGASPLRFTPDAARDELRSALAEIASLEAVPPHEVILIGHSYGAALLAQTVAPHADTAVFLGPNYHGGFASQAPDSTLLVTAERDHAWIVEATRAMVRDLEQAAPVVPEAVRTWLVAPGVGHIGLVYDEGVHQEILGFLERSKGPLPIVPSPRWSSPRVAQIAAASSLGAFLAIAILIAARVRVQAGAPRRRPPATSPLRTSLVFAYAGVIGLLVSSRWAASAVHLVDGGRLASLFVAVGVAACLLDSAFCRGAYLLVLRTRAGIAIGLLLFAGLYAAAALTIDGRLYSTVLGSDRAAVACALFVSLLPFFAFTEGVVTSCDRLSSKILGSIAVCGVWGALALAAPWAFHDSRLFQLLPAIVMMGAVVVLAGAALREVTRAQGASAVFSAACCAWALVIGFPRY